MTKRNLAIGAVLVVALLALSWKAAHRAAPVESDGVVSDIGEPDDGETPSEPAARDSALPFATARATEPAAGERVATGTVLAEGAPFEGARVTAVLEDHSGLGRIQPANNEVALSEKDGRFELARLPDPPFRLFAEAPGWRPGWAEVASLGAASRIDGLVLELAPAGTIRGRVTRDGKPVNLAGLFTGDERGSDLGRSIEAQAATSIDGSYVLDPVRPGRMTIVALDPHEGFATAIVDVSAHGATVADFALAPLGRVRGRVLADDGTPLAQVRVVAVDPGTLDLVPPLDGASKRLLTVATRLQSTLTDAEGRFEIRSLGSRKTSLAIRLPGYDPANRQVDVDTGAGPELEVRMKPAD